MRTVVSLNDDELVWALGRVLKTRATAVRRVESQLACVRTERDVAIVEAHDAGLSISAIARAVGLSRQAVMKVVAKGRVDE